MRRKVIVSLGGLAVMLALAPAALGADGKELSGAACQQDSLSSGDIEHPNTGTVWNDSSSYAGGVDCPMVRDNLAAGGLTLNSTVYIIDENDGDEISCTLYLCNRAGTSCSSSSVSSGDAYTGAKGMAFSPLTTGESRWFYLHCSLPPKDGGNRSEVVSYTWNE